jgi:hypothetical protein
MSLLDDASLLVTPNAEKEGKLYSIIPTNGNGDFSVTRATTATRVNAAGLVELVPYNLFQYSEMFSDASWGKVAVSVSANTTTAPNGALTADTLTANGTNSAHYLTNSATVNNAVTYTYSVYVKKNTNNFVQLFGGIGFASNYFANFDIDNGVTGTIGAGATASITSIGNGWYRCSISGTATSTSSSLNFGLGIITSATSVRAESNTLTTSLFIWGAQLVEGTSSLDYQMTETRLNIPRLDYSLGSCPNILLEPQRTNVLLNTIFSGSGATPTSWTQPVATGTSVLTTSTLGTGAQACSQSATSQRPFLSQSFTLVANTTYSYSIYVESISGGLSNEQILSVSGLPVGATITYFSNGVSVSPSAISVVGRLSIVIVVSVLGGSASFRCGIGTSSNQTGTLLFSRPQLEAGAYATSYIPTSSASVTRNADVISRGNIFTNGLITASGGTWFVDLRNNIPRTRESSASGVPYLGDSNSAGVGNNFRILGFTASRYLIQKFVAGVATTIYTTTSNTSKIAIKWNGTTADVFENGVKVVTATSFTATALDFLAFRTDQVLFNINSTALFPTPLTDTQCIALTT